jgi:hypothetical protein
MLLPFEPLMRTSRADCEMANFADRHYSRRKKGSRQFVGNGSDITLRSPSGDILFVWLKQKYRRDGQQGFNCSKFRNESREESSGLILAAEQKVVHLWGPGRAFTYVDPKEVKSPNPGYCFKKAGWKFVGLSTTGKHILEKHLL